MSALVHTDCFEATQAFWCCYDDSSQMGIHECSCVHRGAQARNGSDSKSAGFSIQAFQVSSNARGVWGGRRLDEQGTLIF